MTRQTASALTIHDPQMADLTALSGGAMTAPRLMAVPSPVRTERPDLDEECLPALWRREALHRRLLGFFDLAGASLMVFLVVGLRSVDNATLAAMVSMPLLVVLFKVAGLYDRDELRLVHSTLDEAPLLLQLTGLFALCVTILEPILLEGTLGPAQIAGLWLGAFAAVLSGRMLARSLAGHISPSERCLLIGDRGLADRVSERLRSSRARAVVVASLPLENGSMDLLSDREGFRNAVSELGVHRIIIAPATTDTSDVTELIRLAKAVGVRVSVLPRMFEAV